VSKALSLELLGAGARRGFLAVLASRHAASSTFPAVGGRSQDVSIRAPPSSRDASTLSFLRLVEFSQQRQYGCHELNAASVLRELLERSEQWRRKVLPGPGELAIIIASTDGEVLASSLEDPGRSDAFARTAFAFVQGAERPDDESPVVQAEVQTQQGAFFLVRDAHHFIATTTCRLAIPSLVSFDLRNGLETLTVPHGDGGSD
jgi:hypothetical protein